MKHSCFQLQPPDSLLTEQVSSLVLFDNHLGDANSKTKEEYVKMAHNLSFGTGRRRDVDNGGERSPVGLLSVGENQ